VRASRTERPESGDRMLVASLYATQGLVLGLALLLIWWQGRSPVALFAVASGQAASVLGHGALAGAAVLLADAALTRLAPDRMRDESGLDERLLAARPLWHLAVICLTVAVCEELLFRGALQPLIGPYWTAALFAAVHVRYLRRWLPMALLFAAGLALGWTMERTGSLAAPAFAHFLIDFVNGLMLRRKGKP